MQFLFILNIVVFYFDYLYGLVLISSYNYFKSAIHKSDDIVCVCFFSFLFYLVLSFLLLFNLKLCNYFTEQF